MSALTASRPHLLPATVCATQSDAAPLHPPSSPDSCYSLLPSLTHSLPSSSSSSIHSIPDRSNEHLAVLLPKHLWKPDSQASRCDNLYCPVRFSLLERRHHCRKCGGVFCASCTSRSTPLLDTSKLDFLHPPRNVPLSTYASPISPIEPCRVCDRCYDQIHGITSIPRIPDLIRPSLTRLLSSPISMLRSPLSSSPTTSGPSSLASSVGMSAHPLAASESAATSLLDTAAPLSRRPSKTRSLRTQSSIASLNGTRRSIIRASHLALPSELNKSYGELDAYPLRRSSILCKATGGGRWEPKQEPELIGYRPPVPGAKAQYELEIERLERDERKRLESPIVRDGEFQYRFPRKTCPVVIACSPSPMSTF